HAVHFLHDVPQRWQRRQAARDRPQRPTLREGQVMLDEKMAMLEKVGALLLQSLTLAGRSFGRRRGRSAALERRLPRGQLFADLGHRPPDRLGQLLEDVELADLV